MLDEDRNTDESAQPQDDENVESQSRSADDEALPGTFSGALWRLEMLAGISQGITPPGTQHKFCACISSSTSCASKLNHVHVTY